MPTRFKSISVRDTNLIKGWAILLIVFHNYFHLIYRVTKENEMDFDAGRFSALITHTLFNPTEWVQGFFTYFGHFGVQLFIFLSAYGVTMAYSDIRGERLEFFFSRLKKIYPAFLLAIGAWLALYLLLDVLQDRKSTAEVLRIFQLRLFDVSKVIFGVHNFFPGHHYPVVGPWWFIPFIVQFYLLWALFGGRLSACSRRALMGLGMAGIAFNYLAVPFAEAKFRINLLYSPLGHIPEIVLGIYWAKYGVVLSRKFVLCSFVIFIGSSLSLSVWPLHHITALVLMLWLAGAVLSCQSGSMERFLYYLGAYSMPLFLVNGFLRAPFLKLSRHFDVWFVDILMAITFFIVAFMAAVILKMAEVRLVRLISIRKSAS